MNSISIVSTITLAYFLTSQSIVKASPIFSDDGDKPTPFRYTFRVERIEFGDPKSEDGGVIYNEIEDCTVEDTSFDEYETEEDETILYPEDNGEEECDEPSYEYEEDSDDDYYIEEDDEEEDIPDEGDEEDVPDEDDEEDIPDEDDEGDETSYDDYNVDDESQEEDEEHVDQGGDDEEVDIPDEDDEEEETSTEDLQENDEDEDNSYEDNIIDDAPQQEEDYPPETDYEQEESYDDVTTEGHDPDYYDYLEDYYDYSDDYPSRKTQKHKQKFSPILGDIVTLRSVKRNHHHVQRPGSFNKNLLKGMKIPFPTWAPKRRARAGRAAHPHKMVDTRPSPSKRRMTHPHKPHHKLV